MPGCHEIASQRRVELVGPMNFCQRGLMAKAPSRGVPRTTSTRPNVPFQRAFVGLLGPNPLKLAKSREVSDVQNGRLCAFRLDLFRYLQELSTRSPWAIPSSCQTALSSRRVRAVGQCWIIDRGSVSATVRQPRHQADNYRTRNSEAERRCRASKLNLIIFSV